jgi:hypothetical protein
VIRAFLTLTGLARHLQDRDNGSREEYQAALDKAKEYFPNENTGSLHVRAILAEKERNMGCLETALRVPGDQPIVKRDDQEGKWLHVTLECGHQARVRKTNGEWPKKAPCRMCHQKMLREIRKNQKGK